MISQHGRTEVLEYGHVASCCPADQFRQLDSAAFHDYVNVFALSAEKAVPYITSYYESPDAFALCSFRYDLKNPVVKKTLCNCHNVSKDNYKN